MTVLSKRLLDEHAKALNIQGRSKMKREELAAAVESKQRELGVDERFDTADEAGQQAEAQLRLTLEGAKPAPNDSA